MTCKEAENLVMPYIRHELDMGQVEEFLEHIDQCGDCREELEIYYTVEVGIRQLDSDTDTDRYNIKGDMETDIIASRQAIYKLRLITILHYAADTLMVMSLVVMLIMQFRIWWQTGIF
ncbi:MAG: zf-HC2 domain-containing protein [Hungatella sp.]|nr:zf-HC2 domain-containing protein [Hungatella sp.]